MEKKTDFEQERQRLTRWAWGVTGGYGVILLILSAFVVFGEEGVDAFRRMSPNEVGDLLAGVAGPVAFIWLVYGYFLQGIAIKQQSEELSQNTAALKLQEEALRAQAEELKNSVSQQRDLVDASRRQAEATMAAVQFEIERDTNTAKPIFVFEILQVTPYTSAAAILSTVKPEKVRPQYLIEAVLRNQGNVGTEIFPTLEGLESSIFPRKIPSMKNENSERINFVLEPGGEISYRLIIDFRDSNNRNGKQFFELTPHFHEDGRLRWLESSKLIDS